MASKKTPKTAVVPAASTAKVTPPTTATSIPFDKFTESTVSAVLRAASAQNLSHVPIVIGVIFHPGLGSGGSGGYGTQPSCGFVSTVKPFFTDCYRQHMMFMFDLWDASAVQQNWQAIHDSVASGSMPAPGCPGTFDQNAFLAAFQCWKDQGFPA